MFVELCVSVAVGGSASEAPTGPVRTTQNPYPAQALTTVSFLKSLGPGSPCVFHRPDMSRACLQGYTQTR